MRRAVDEGSVKGVVECGQVIARNLCDIGSQERGPEGGFCQGYVMGCHAWIRICVSRIKGEMSIVNSRNIRVGEGHT